MEGSYITDFFRNKWVRVVLIFDVIIVITLIILAITKSTTPSMISFDVAPLDAQITLNNQGEYSNGSYEIPPGDYQVTISHDGLDSKTFDVSLEQGENAKITTYLTKDGSIDYYKQKDYLTSFNKLLNLLPINDNLTTDQDISASDQVRALQSAQLAMNNLPINDVLYNDTPTGRELDHDVTIRVSANSSCQTWLCLEALMLGTNSQELVNTLLEDNNLNVEDYEILYQTY